MEDSRGQEPGLRAGQDSDRAETLWATQRVAYPLFHKHCQENWLPTLRYVGAGSVACCLPSDTQALAVRLVAYLPIRRRWLCS